MRRLVDDLLGAAGLTESGKDPLDAVRMRLAAGIRHRVEGERHVVAVLVGVPGVDSTLEPLAGWADLRPKLKQRPNDQTVLKKTWGAFTDTGLDERLKNLAVTPAVKAVSPEATSRRGA